MQLNAMLMRFISANRLMTRRFFPLCLILLTLTACGSSMRSSERPEDTKAKAMLQGIWIDEASGMVWIRVEGDTIYYADNQNAPVAFRVVHDSIYLTNAYGVQAYKIDSQTEEAFWFHAVDKEDIVKIYKSDNPSDSLLFQQREVKVISPVKEPIKRDSVVYFQGNRYHGYVQINPSTMKVTRTTYSDNGLATDNVYYDNVIHICVYQGTELLYGKNIVKQIFEHILDKDYLNSAILSDMHFLGVDAKGFHFQATLSIPESQVYRTIRLTIHEGKILLVSA